MVSRLRRGSQLLVTVVAMTAFGAGGCAPAEPDDADARDDASASAVSSGIETPGLPSVFDRDRLLDDALYVDAESMTAAQIQAFFEATPYGRRSWLADMEFGGVRVSELVSRAARAHHINPLMLLGRMQNEQGLVSRNFTASTIPRFGLGCNQTNPRAAALDAQLECAATTLESQFQKAERGENNFPVGRPAQTLDRVTVTPENKATSAMYAYTPWEGTRAGNGSYLAWQVLRRFAVHLASTGS